jgi:flagellum-specific ATP synthase
MPSIADEDSKAVASFARDLLATYKESEDLINLGAYVKGSNKKVDMAITYYDKIIDFLKQGVNEHCDLSESLSNLKQIFM